MNRFDRYTRGIRHPFKSGMARIAMLAFLIATVAIAPRWASADEPPLVPSDNFNNGIGEYNWDTSLTGHWAGDMAMQIAVEAAVGPVYVVYEVGSIAAKYAVRQFFNHVSRPLEYWLYTVQTWRYQTGLNAPEDFRTLTMMMLDQQVDLMWIARYCYEVHTREGWEAYYPATIAYIDDDAYLDEFESGLESDFGNIAPDPADSTAESIHGSVAHAAMAPISAKGITAACKIYEKMVVDAAEQGLLENLGIPKGVTRIDLRYSGDKGPDGFFAKDGEIYCLEAKHYTSRNGCSLGTTTVKVGAGTKDALAHRITLEAKDYTLTQTSPSWIQKALYKQYTENPAKFMDNLNKVDTLAPDFSEVMRGIKALADNEDLIIDRLAPGAAPQVKEEMRGMIRNFTPPDLNAHIFHNIGELSDGRILISVERMGKALADDLVISVSMLRFGKPTYVDDAIRNILDVARLYGAKGESARRFIYGEWKKGMIAVWRVATRLVL